MIVMVLRTMVLLHGYGVRSDFWTPVTTFFESKFPQIFTPSLDMTTLDRLVETTSDYLTNLKERYDTNLFLVGHSLGGSLAATLAHELGPEVVHKVVVMATPYGQRTVKAKGTQRFLIRHQLIPWFLARRRFFSKQTPKEVQKMYKRQIVPETDELLEVALADEWWHTSRVGKLEQESLAIYSEADKIVPGHQTQQLAEVLGADHYVLPKKRKVGHNDLVTAPLVAQEVAEKIIDFCLAGKDRW